MRAGQWPALSRNDPFNVFGAQRYHTLLIALANCCKEILYNLDIVFDGHRNLSISLTSERVRSNLNLGITQPFSLPPPNSPARGNATRFGSRQSLRRPQRQRVLKILLSHLQQRRHRVVTFQMGALDW